MQYPLVEATTAGLFAVIGASYIALDPLRAGLSLLLIAVLVAIAAYDILAKSHPKRRWGAEAAFLAGYLRFQHGQWADATAALERLQD